MKLYYSPTSPYARKCRALILEKGLENRTEFIESTPLDNPKLLLQNNSLAKVPVLERESGPALMNSSLICDYVDSLSDENWIPRSGESRVLVLRQQAIADGLMDITIGRRIELTRDETLIWDYWVERWSESIHRTVAQINHERASFERSVDLGALSIAIALFYLDLRYSEFNWRNEYPDLVQFAQRWSERSSFKTTEPPKV